MEEAYRAKLEEMNSSIEDCIALVNALRSVKDSGINRIIVSMNDVTGSIISSGVSSQETRNALFRLVDVLEPGECPIGHSATDTLLSNGARLLAVAMARIYENNTLDEEEDSAWDAAELSAREAAGNSTRNTVVQPVHPAVAEVVSSAQGQGEREADGTATVKTEKQEGKKEAEDAAQDSVLLPTQEKRKRGRPRKYFTITVKDEEARTDIENVAKEREKRKNEEPSEKATPVEAVSEKRKRGRPRIHFASKPEPLVKRPRGRPRKYFPVKEEQGSLLDIEYTNDQLNPDVKTEIDDLNDTSNSETPDQQSSSLFRAAATTVVHLEQASSVQGQETNNGEEVIIKEEMEEEDPGKKKKKREPPALEDYPPSGSSFLFSAPLSSMLSPLSRAMFNLAPAPEQVSPSLVEAHKTLPENLSGPNPSPEKTTQASGIPPVY